MKLRAHCILTGVLLTACYALSNNTGLLTNALLNDAQALAYCTQNPNTYIVIVWPKGYDHLPYIIESLNQHGSVKYVKHLVLTKKQIFSLFRTLHPEMSYGSAKKFFKPYINMLSYKHFAIAALVLQIDASLEQIVYLKHEIRRHIGEMYYSFHINDYYAETIEAAEELFLS